MVIQSFLANSFDVVTVNDGQECLDIVSKRLPDLIVTDIEMPVMDGLEACKQLRIDDNYQHIPVIFMSTLPEEKVIDKCNEVGGNHFFQKPVDKDKLMAKIKELAIISTTN